MKLERGNEGSKSMVTILNDPALSTFLDGEEYKPLCNLLERLAKQPYADKIYAGTSLAHVALEIPPGDDAVGIDYDSHVGCSRLVTGNGFLPPETQIAKKWLAAFVNGPMQ